MSDTTRCAAPLPIVACNGHLCGAPLYRVTGRAGSVRYVNTGDMSPHTCARWPRDLGVATMPRRPYLPRHHAGQVNG